MTHISDVSRSATPLTSTPGSVRAASQNGSDSGNSSASVTANDFLTLLVTEMKNQDPTTQTDPTQYINQLVQVNSLQQLISINQTLSNSLGSNGNAAPVADAERLSQQPASRQIEKSCNTSFPPDSHPVQGNLSVPHSSSASQTVANALVAHF